MEENDLAATPRSHWPLSILSTASAIVTILLPVILVRILSPEEIGHYKILFLYLALVPGLTLAGGLFNGLALWVGRRAEGTHVLLSGALLHMLAVLAFLVAWLFSEIFADYFSVSHAAGQLFAGAVGLSIASRYYEEMAVFSGRIWSGALFGAGFEVLRTLAMIGLGVAMQSLEGVLLGHVAVVAVKMILSVVFSVRAGWLGRTALKMSELVDVGRYAFPVGFAALFGFVFSYADQFVLSHALPPEEFAIFAIGCLAIPPLLILEYSITRVAIPHLTRCFSQGALEEASRLYRHMLSQLAFVLLPAGVFLCVFAEPLIVFLFTEAYRDAALFLQIFSLTYILLIFPQDVVARARGDGRWIFRTSVIFLVVTMVLTIVGVYVAGAVGALLGALCGRALLRLYAHYYAMTVNNWGLSETFPIAILKRYLGFSLIAALPSGLLLGTDLPPFLVVMLGWLIFSVTFLALFVLSKPRKVEGQDSGRISVLMIIPAFRRGGLEKLAAQLGSSLQSAGECTVSVAAFDNQMPLGGKDCREEFQEAGLQTFAYDKTPGFSVGAVLFLLDTMSRSRAAVLHTHDLGSLLYGVLAKLFYPYRVRLVHTQHSFVHLQKASRYVLYEKVFTRFADRVIVVAPSLLERYRELGISERALLHIPNGVPASELPEYSKEQLAKHVPLFEQLVGRRWLVNVARLSPEKGQEKTLQCLADNAALSGMFDSSTGEWSLIFAGPARDADFESQLQTMVPDGCSVVFLGDVAFARRLLRVADAAISLSSCEGLPLVALEALAEGTPLFASNIEGHKALASQATLVSTANVVELREALRDFLATLPTMAPSRKARQEFVEEHFSFAQMIQSYVEVYRENRQHA